MTRGKRTGFATTLAVDVSNELWCSCQRPEDGRFMIHCDVQGEGCRVWYHGDCVGITNSIAR